MTSIFTYIFTHPQVFFKHFGSKNQLPGLSVNETLLKNGIIILFRKRGIKPQFLYHLYVQTIAETGPYNHNCDIITMR